MQLDHTPRLRRKPLPATPLAKLLAPVWRHLAPDQLEQRILLIQRMAADVASPYRLRESDWRVLDRMRQAAKYHAKYAAPRRSRSSNAKVEC
jgi:hypothetical protein